MAKLPLPSTINELGQQEPEFARVQMVLWRVHFRGGTHPSGWDELRYYGPLGSRFDPQPVGQARVGPEGVAYAATSVPTALAEVFQTSRTIHLTRQDPWLAGWEPTRELVLLDLTGQWPLRIGASHAINTGRRDHCRAWARALRAAWPTADGLLHTSSMTAQPSVTLYNPARDTFPQSPAVHFALADPRLADPLLRAAAAIGYELT